MDTRAFVEELLNALANLEEVKQVGLSTEGPTVSGRAYLHSKMFLSFYYNEETETMAFALIQGQNRIWGIDCDNIRGWHLHPAEDPDHHVAIDPLSVSDIIQQLAQVIRTISDL